MRALRLRGETRQSWTTSSDIVDVCHRGEGSTLVLRDDGVLEETSKGVICELASVLEDEQDLSATPLEWFHLSQVPSRGKNEVLCICREGHMVVVHLETKEAEVVGSLEQGVDAATWNPDGTSLLVVTKSEADDESPAQKTVLLTLTSEWTVVSEVQLDMCHKNGEPVHVCYRPNGDSLVVSFIDEYSNGENSDEQVQRRLRWYDARTLAQTAVGRVEEGSGILAQNIQPSELTWATSDCSSLVACVQRKGKSRRQAAFFEPNGLRHGEFMLRLQGSDRVTILRFNATSSLLAIVISSDSEDDCVQLWHRSNYRWYLSKSVHVPFVCTLHWDSVVDTHLCIVSKDTKKSGTAIFTVRNYWLMWDDSTVSAKSGLSYVVDGALIDLTPLSQSIVPPPMCACQLSMPHLVQEVVLVNNMGDTALESIIMFKNGMLMLLISSCLQRASRWNAPTLSNCGSIENLRGGEGVDLNSLRQIICVECPSPSHVVLSAVALRASSIDTTYRECVVIISITWAGKDVEASVAQIISAEFPVVSQCCWNGGTTGAVVQLEDGSLFELARIPPDGPFRLVSLGLEPMLEPCPWMTAFKKDVDLENSPTENHAVLGRTFGGRLYIGDFTVHDSTSCHFVTRDFLCFISYSSRCYAHFIPLESIFNFDSFVDDMDQLRRGIEPRPVERGARLVAVLPRKSTNQLILQLPRGNLEVLTPRALLLRDVIVKMKDWRAAESHGGEVLMNLLESLRINKVDLNIIIDIAPNAFISRGSLECAKSCEKDLLCLLVRSVRNGDSMSKYDVSMWLGADEQSDRNNFDFSSKVNQVCVCLRNALLEQGQLETSDPEFFTVMSTFAKHEPPQLQEALRLIRSRSKGDITLVSDSTQSSIEYLAFLSEHSLLFDAALGLYDYELAKAIARNAPSMDPKVYLPLLRQYCEWPRHYAHCRVALRLGMFDEALRELVHSHRQGEVVVVDGGYSVGTAFFPTNNSVEDCCALSQQYALHKLGLELFSTDPDIRRRILVGLGDYMTGQAKHKNALSAYMCAGERSKTVQAAKKCLDWSAYMGALDDLSQLPAHAQLFANELVSQAEQEWDEERKQELLRNAAQITLDYCVDDIQRMASVDWLLQGRLWSEASCVSTRFSIPRKKCVDAGIDFAQSTVIDFKDRSDQFRTVFARFQEVAAMRRNARENYDEVDQLDDSGSVFSSSSTVASDASLLSKSSRGSVGSVGSVTTLSSVLSIKTTSTFKVTGSESEHRFRSKYNSSGRREMKKKKKQDKRRARSRKVQPGSQAELDSLVQTLRTLCVGAHVTRIIGDTIIFLSRCGQTEVAKSLFEAYENFRHLFSESIDSSGTVDGLQPETVEAVRSLHCNELSTDVRDLNDYLLVI